MILLLSFAGWCHRSDVGCIQIEKIFAMKHLQTLAVLAVLAFLSACNVATDAATRLAYDLEAGAKRLNTSDKNELEVEHRPLSSPNGISGDYTILLQALQTAIVRRVAPWPWEQSGGNDLELPII